MHEYLPALCCVRDDELGSEEPWLFEAIVVVFFSVIVIFHRLCSSICYALICFVVNSSLRDKK